MEAYTTNNDPKVVADYYIQNVTQSGGCPERIRADHGTENGHVANMQVFLRRNHDDSFAGDNSFVYGRSTGNQRIESLWGVLRKQSVQFWMNIFKTLQDDGQFSGDFLDKNLVQFCFLGLVQELDEVVQTWNTHKIRLRPGQDVHSGHPVLMYTVPSLYGAEDKLKLVEPEEVAVCKEECTPKSQIPCDETVYDLSVLLMQENQWGHPSDELHHLEQ
ncbi:uncharacterized protein LOC117503115 [Thalassophryne amazonica]|uniref:uncharacterized protein LOC117503115 n=1 Tax=Thalassophryne amazonica TaxID=390379 RepID=UPI0014714634|nr:uncharacterized protein LOC117503115 [Thalassophryne amazonica]